MALSLWMMKSYLENQEKAKIYHEHRKNELVRQTILDFIEEHTNLNNTEIILEAKKDKKNKDEDMTDDLDKEINLDDEKLVSTKAFFSG